MNNTRYKTPDFKETSALLELSRKADLRDVEKALTAEEPDIRTLAVLLSPAAIPFLEQMAVKARNVTRRYFGSTIKLYAPLYISDYCSNSCVYCGFAANRARPRRKLEREEMLVEMLTLKNMGLDEILLLTGERAREADFDYLKNAVTLAAEHFNLVTAETFPMTTDEYRTLAECGCSGITIYQETYDADVYKKMHAQGPKSDYENRVDTPARVLAAGLRFAGMGILLGLADPIADALLLFHHFGFLRKTYWRAGLSISFPRICPQLGEFMPPHPVVHTFLAQMIFAFRVCLPDVPLLLSTRENASFRDGMAGVGISKMSVASKTAVGGYHNESSDSEGQFMISDNRDIASFCAMLKNKGLEPVFKNWHATYRNEPT